VQDLDGGIGRLRRLPYSNGTIQPIKLPFDGAIQSLVTNPTEAGAWMDVSHQRLAGHQISYALPQSGHVRNTQALVLD